MSLPTFKQFLSESLADLAKGKGVPARANYPKTNFKRFMDDWNEKLGKWVASGRQKGYTISKRVNASDGPMVIDLIDQDKLVSTAVISGHDDMKSGNFTFDFYNQESVHSPNKYRVNPGETSYEKDWVWKMIEGDTLHHSDQRNVFTSSKDGRTMANSRVKDGDAPSWATALRGNKKK
jgi:hypothetical protein